MVIKMKKSSMADVARLAGVDVYKRQILVKATSCGFKSLHPHQVHVTKKISVDFVA